MFVCVLQAEKGDNKTTIDKLKAQSSAAVQFMKSYNPDNLTQMDWRKSMTQKLQRLADLEQTTPELHQVHCRANPQVPWAVVC